MLHRRAETVGNVLNAGAALDQAIERLELVGRVHAGAYDVFDEREFDGLVRLADRARNLVVGFDDTLDEKLAQGVEATAARVDEKAAVLRVLDTEILLQPMGGDRRLQCLILGLGDAGLAHVLR